MAKKRTYDAVNAEIIAALDIQAEYQAMGVKMARNEPRASGKIQCYAVGREDNRPSAYVDTTTGRYNDSATGESLSLWDFAATHSNFADWQEARRHFASKAGVKLGSGKSKDDWRTKLEFYPWDKCTTPPAKVWCAKRNFSFGAARAAGARFARFPCWIDKDTGIKRLGEFKVIAFPCYGARLTDADPAAWVVMNLFGEKLRLYRGKGKPPEWHTKLSVGPTGGTLMNAFALMQLASNSDAVEWIFKTAGPTDMLALMSRIPRDKTRSHLVVTNASGETGDIPGDIAGVFAGQRVAIIHDADKGGEVGAAKWLSALSPVAKETRHVRLYPEIADKHGKDLRDYADEFDASRQQDDKHDDILRPSDGNRFADAAALN